MFNCCLALVFVTAITVLVRALNSLVKAYRGQQLIAMRAELASYLEKCAREKTTPARTTHIRHSLDRAAYYQHTKKWSEFGICLDTAQDKLNQLHEDDNFRKFQETHSAHGNNAYTRK